MKLAELIGLEAPIEEQNAALAKLLAIWQEEINLARPGFEGRARRAGMILNTFLMITRAGKVVEVGVKKEAVCRGKIKGELLVQTQETEEKVTITMLPDGKLFPTIFPSEGIMVVVDRETGEYLAEMAPDDIVSLTYTKYPPR